MSSVPHTHDHGHAHDAHDHHDHHEHIHGYLGVLKLAGGGGLVLAFCLASLEFYEALFRRGQAHEAIVFTVPVGELYLGESMGIVIHREQYRPRLACLYHSTLHLLLAASYRRCRLGRFQVTSACRTIDFTSLDRCHDASLGENRGRRAAVTIERSNSASRQTE